jgi:hypothetical protein
MDDGRILEIEAGAARAQHFANGSADMALAV